MGKHSERNRRKKVKAQEKKLEEHLALEDTFVKLKVKGAS